jgi:hypothetical protein
VAGCGWADADRTVGESSVELFAPGAAEAGPLVTLERERPGCAVSVLRDGSLLVTGGFELGSTAGADAAIVVPWMDSADPA